MKSVLGGLAQALNRVPISYAPNRGLSFPAPLRNDAEAQMAAMGSVGTLFSIVTRLTNATSQVHWRLYRSAASGLDEDRVEITRHLALDIWRKPNPYFTCTEFVETFQQHQELTGESWWIVARNPTFRSLPLELWPVRPDRMAPIPSADGFLAGYVYTAASGEQVPLALDEVIQLKLPNPLDIYRGMGPVQSILTDLDSSRYSAEWNRNFFLNSAEPGGIIEVDKRLGDDEFQEMRARWSEQHRGVAQAHRVAILEQGKWVDRKFTQRDMQFAELRNVSRDVIREAFGMPKFAVGDVDDVNRATADASKAWFAEQLTVPRLERTKQALNSRFLPMFGPTGVGVEFDYDSPVPADQDAERAERESKANAAEKYISAGFEPAEVLLMLGVPAMKMAPRQPAPSPAPPAQEPQPAARHRHGRVLDLAATDINLDQVQADWEKALRELIRDWTDITAAQRDEIADQVRAAVNNNDPAALAAITVTSSAGAALLAAAMIAHAELAAGRVVAEAADQGVSTEQGVADALVLTALAGVVATLLAAGLGTAAAREALRRYSSSADGAEVARAVDAHLAGLSTTFLADQLGAALTGAQNAGRVATLMLAPEGALYASEVMDGRTCLNCRAANGRWLGNTSDLSTVDATYPNGGYVDCEGGNRCRGTIVGVWRPDQVKGP